MLPSLAIEPPAGEHWIHEIKFDGYRTVLVIEDGEARAFTRNRLDWSDRYRPIVEAASKLRCRSAVIDGEVVVLASLATHHVAEQHWTTNIVGSTGHLSDFLFTAWTTAPPPVVELRRRTPVRGVRRRLGACDPGSLPLAPLAFQDIAGGVSFASALPGSAGPSIRIWTVVPPR
jgi:hypothetical protein